MEFGFNLTVILNHRPCLQPFSIKKLRQAHQNRGSDGRMIPYTLARGTRFHLLSDRGRTMEQPPSNRPRHDQNADPVDAEPETLNQEESLFEEYRPRSIATIKAQQQAIRDSEAAESARVILEGVSDPEFDFSSGEHQQPAQACRPDEGSLYKAKHARHAHTEHSQFSLTRQLFSPGAQFVYALLIITALAGLIGLAATIESPVLVLIAGIASPMLLPICIWKWIRWLDSTPYYYRLLTSLGEDARNLLSYRLLWKRSS